MSAVGYRKLCMSTYLFYYLKLFVVVFVESIYDWSIHCFLSYQLDMWKSEFLTGQSKWHLRNLTDLKQLEGLKQLDLMYNGIMPEIIQARLLYCFLTSAVC